MKKIVLTLLLTALIIPAVNSQAEASLISNRSYRIEQNKENKQAIKQIKSLFEVHNTFANKHGLTQLKNLYADNYINNDGFNKDAYFKSIEETWKACEDLTYSTKIESISVNGDNASVQVIETASGTIHDTMDFMPVSGEIHSTSTGIYHLVKVNDRWLISGETSLTDESSLLYGDARFMNIEIQAPAQVSSGETYTTTVKVDGENNDNTFIVGSIDHDPVSYPASTPKTELRALPQTQVLERLIKANTDNVNEYEIASLAISKARNVNDGHFQVYMSGLACVMKRVNVVPKNNLIKIED